MGSVAIACYRGAAGSTMARPQPDLACDEPGPSWISAVCDRSSRLLADGRGRVCGADEQLFDQKPVTGLHGPGLAQPVTIKEAVAAALPTGQLIAAWFHLAIPIDKEANHVVLRCRPLDLDR